MLVGCRADRLWWALPLAGDERNQGEQGDQPQTVTELFHVLSLRLLSLRQNPLQLQVLKSVLVPLGGSTRGRKARPTVGRCQEWHWATEVCPWKLYPEALDQFQGAAPCPE